MNIYSIEEIVNATKNILDANVDRAVKKSINTSNESISPDVENIIREAEKAQILKKKKCNKHRIAIDFKKSNFR